MPNLKNFCYSIQEILYSQGCYGQRNRESANTIVPTTALTAAEAIKKWIFNFCYFWCFHLVAICDACNRSIISTGKIKVINHCQAEKLQVLYHSLIKYLFFWKLYFILLTEYLQNRDSLNGRIRQNGGRTFIAHSLICFLCCNTGQGLAIENLNTQHALGTLMDDHKVFIPCCTRLKTWAWHGWLELLPWPRLSCAHSFDVK